MSESPGTNLRRWADEQQYVAAPLRAERTDTGGIIPKVHLLWMTPDPLGAVAAMGEMYKGNPVYDLADVTDDQRRNMLEQVQRTHLKAPLEVVKLHFMIEGVTRSFTHQMVRQRTAVYAQESLRFAVKEDLAAEVSIPPSIAALPKSNPVRQDWDAHMQELGDFYNYLVANGIPAEDARAVMPHGVTTRLNYCTDLRNLAEHAGNRLCTQAQFEWRIVFMGIVQAIRNYIPDFWWVPDKVFRQQTQQEWEAANRWQFEAIANSGLFRPVCYQLGRCQFHADFDRECTIRERVDRFADEGVPSSQWGSDEWMTARENHLEMIDPAEWLADPAAARKTSGGGGHD